MGDSGGGALRSRAGRAGVGMRVRGRWAVAVAVVVLAQVPAQAIVLDALTSAPAGAKTAACGVTAPTDPPLWEQSLPIAKVSSAMLASDPGCVREVGRAANGVVWRGPDQKLTARLYQSPVNFQAADGAWHAIDTRLVGDGKGGFTNRAGPFSVHLGSDASASSLVRLASAKTSLSFGFDGALQTTTSALVVPASSAVADVGGEGSDTVTYANVLPGVDVEYHLLSDALKEAIVLNRPLPTGVSPQFKFSVSMSGLSAQTADDGTVEFVDASSDRVVFAIPPGTAFDSSGDPLKGTTPATTPVAVQLIASADPSEATLVVSVDSRWLSDPARVFPIMIDPTTTTNTVSSDASLSSATPNTPCDGACQNVWPIGYIDPSGKSGAATYRSLLAYPSLSGLTGNVISSATWNGYAVTGIGTPPSTVTLNPVSASWTASSVTWNSQPAVRTESATVSYTTGGSWLSADITTWVQNWTATSGAWGQYGIRLDGPSTANTAVYFAAQEATAAYQSYLQITYDAPPTTSNLTAGGRLIPAWANSTTPTLSAQINDTDTKTGLAGKFQVWDFSGTNLLYSGTGSSVASGEKSTWTVPSALTPGTFYTWRVQGDDGTETGPWSTYQLVVALTSPPNTPTVSVSGVALNAWNAAGTGSTTATFGDSSPNMYGFQWGIDVDHNPTTSVLWNAGIPGAQVTITPTWGWHTLSVRALDKAGNVSAVTDYTFGWGAGGFSTPQTNFTTQKRVTAQANSSSGYNGIVLQWRRSEAGTWTNIPVANVTYQSTGGAVSAWPVTTTPGTYLTAYPALVWDAATTAGSVDGSLQLRAGFYNSGTYTYVTATASIPNLLLDQSAFGTGYATTEVGPGRVNLLTGNLEVAAMDASVPGNKVSRTFQSRGASVSGGVFGPGWSSNIQGGDASYRQLVDNTSTVVITRVDGSIMSFRKQTSGAYSAADGNTDETLTKISSSRFQLKLVNFSTTYGFTHGSAMPAGVFMFSDYKDETGATATTTWTVVSSITRPTQMVAAPPPGVTCTSTPLTTKGCQTVTFTYATATAVTALCGNVLGDVNGQLRKVSFTAWDPDAGTGAMHTVDVATYCYDTSTRLLRTTWDPRITPNLVTTYTYNGNGQIATLAPPGQSAWTLAYAPLAGEPANTGRLSTASRPAVAPASGNAITTLRYQIPLTTSGGGAYDLDAATVAGWAQHDLATDATAVFPPDQIPSGAPPSSYTRATVYYLNAKEQLVNVAEPGGEISTTEHDRVGNVIRTLTASNQQEALAASSDPAVQASESSLIDSQAVYDSAGINVIDTYGPAHAVSLPDGTVIIARQHTHNTYDQGSPGGATYNLVTTSTKSAAPVDGSAEQDVRTTTNAYAIGADTSGWTLGTALQITTDPGSSPHLNLTTTTKYNATTGNMTARMLPANPSGGDAHETDFIYYTADASSGDSACNSHPEYAGLLCKTKPNTQPGTVGLPNLATTQITKYNMWGQAEVTVDTNGSDNRTATIGYDAGGRPVTQTITATAGATLPQITTGYDATTGLLATLSDGSGTTTHTYDALGRLSSYQDADSNTTNYTYDLLDNILTINDGKGTTTYTYDTSSEPRGLLTGISDTQAGNFSGYYDADGRLSAQFYPGTNFVAAYVYDEAGDETSLTYTGLSGGTWPTFDASYNVHGQRTTETGTTLDTFAYAYDAAGRLTQTNEGMLFNCVQRNYAFDADSNRTQLSTKFGGGIFNPTPCPPQGTPTLKSFAYDGADRITTSGYGYDAFGRTTTVPAADSPSGYATTLSYYTNDLVNTIAANGTTLTYNLDPNRHVRTWSSSADNQTHTNHYTTDGDSPAWTTENTAATNWTRNVDGFDGLGATVNQTGAVSLQLSNLHGDIFSTISPTTTDWGADFAWNATDEYGNADSGVGIPAGTRYDYLGTEQRQRDTNSGFQLMGQRVFNPTTGRFLQTDPVLGGSANPYEYCFGDPVNCTDLGGTLSTRALAEYLCAGALDPECIDKYVSQHGSAAEQRAARMSLWTNHHARMVMVQHARELTMFYALVAQAILRAAWERAVRAAIAHQCSGPPGTDPTLSVPWKKRCIDSFYNARRRAEQRKARNRAPYAGSFRGGIRRY
jgi:RHS repeat-associated protein